VTNVLTKIQTQHGHGPLGGFRERRTKWGGNGKKRRGGDESGWGVRSEGKEWEGRKLKEMRSRRQKERIGEERWE